MNMNTENIEVANGGRITLPELNDEDKEFGMTAEIRTYIRQTIHHPNWIGWPTTEEFGKVGILLQPLDDQTARALLVIDDEHAMRFLATLRFAYEHLQLHAAALTSGNAKGWWKIRKSSFNYRRIILGSNPIIQSNALSK